MVKRFKPVMALLLCLGTAVVNAHDSERELKRILVLHSYEPSYQWTNAMQKGIEKGLEQTDNEVKLSIEYLDAKRIHSDGYFQQIAQYMLLKYQDYIFDGIIISDDAALQFVQRYLPNFQRDAQWVAVGINDEQASLVNTTPTGTVLYERDRVEENIKLINLLRPSIKNLYYLADQSMTSELIRQRVAVEMEKFPQINFVEIRDKSLSEAALKLSDVDPNDAVLLTHFNTEIEQNTYHTYQQVAHTIGMNSNAPVFVLWELYLGEPGIVGGFVNRPDQFGYEAATLMAAKIGLPIAPLGQRSTMSSEVLDYVSMKKYDINRYDIPQTAHIINQPNSAFKVSFKHLLGAGATIVLLSLVIVGQFITIRQRKEIDQKNRKIVSLQKRTLSVQKEMIHVLGEAIESRSGETGQHVKRVARLSALLAELYGLSHREVEMIEIISPMHDVGKISVPESILDKSGPLTSEEWEVMKLHTLKGYELLNMREGEITNLAAIVAHEHHERWDGMGYPNGLKGVNIHIFARIVSIVDVFDALLSERCYKRAWTIDEVVEFLLRERGQHFDPVLCQLVLDNLERFVEERHLYPDCED
ncbi:HD domain-containing phosphohydrolase [Vibrio alfacsensis]|uniref:HD domain-containing phosphohydrolase n=1 Tax=Vibrio alfacsensis TaxID=1074311 RepID=UPI00406915A8